MTEPLKWALVDLLKLLNATPGAQHEKIEGIAAGLGVDIHHSRPQSISLAEFGERHMPGLVEGAAFPDPPVNWRKEKRATRG